jgi:hypothetical protein
VGQLGGDPVRKAAVGEASASFAISDSLSSLACGDASFDAGSAGLAGGTSIESWWPLVDVAGTRDAEDMRPAVELACTECSTLVAAFGWVVDKEACHVGHAAVIELRLESSIAACGTMSGRGEPWMLRPSVPDFQKRNKPQTHCWHCTDWDGPGNRMAPPAAGEVAVPGWTGRKGIGAAEELAGWTGAAKGSAPEPETVQAGTDGGSRDEIVGLHRAANAGDAAAVVSLTPSGGDACSQRRV